MANELMRATWACSGIGWVENAQMFDRALAPFAEAVLRTADLGSGDRVLDIGCGSGALLEQAAALGAVPVGVDISCAATSSTVR